MAQEDVVHTGPEGNPGNHPDRPLVKIQPKCHTFIDDSSESRVFCWAASGLTQRQLDALLTACAEDQAFPLILDQSMCWIYCPYDGGADVVLATEAERLWLEERHSDWLPD